MVTWVSKTVQEVEYIGLPFASTPVSARLSVSVWLSNFVVAVTSVTGADDCRVTESVCVWPTYTWSGVMSVWTNFGSAPLLDEIESDAASPKGARVYEGSCILSGTGAGGFTVTVLVAVAESPAESETA